MSYENEIMITADGRKIPPLAETRLNLARLQGERAVNREKLRSNVREGLATLRGLVFDPEMIAAVEPTVRRTGEDSAVVIMRMVQPHIDEFEARHADILDPASEFNASIETPRSDNPGPTEAAFYNTLNGGKK